MKYNTGFPKYGEFLSQVDLYLDESTIRIAADVEYGQWENSFEAILIALTNSKRNEVVLNFELAELLAHEAGVDVEGVLDPVTWSKFVRWHED